MTDTLTPQPATYAEMTSAEDTGDRPPGYYLSADDWPTNVPRDTLSVDDVYDVLDTFAEVYDIAMDGLCKVT